MARSLDMAARGRIGAHVTLARHDPVELTAKARATYRASFVDHSSCAMCGHPPAIPTDLPELERVRRAEHLRRAHYARMVRRRRDRRAA